MDPTDVINIRPDPQKLISLIVSDFVENTKAAASETLTLRSPEIQKDWLTEQIIDLIKLRQSLHEQDTH